MEIEVPSVFIDVSEADGRHEQMDFGQLLVRSRKVIIFGPPVCTDCGLEKPNHTKYCRYRNR